MRHLPLDIFGELDLPDHHRVLEVRFSSRDTLSCGDWLYAPAPKRTRLSGMCGLRVSNAQLGAIPKVALVSLSVNNDFRGNPSTIQGPQREIHRLDLNRGRLYAEWNDLIRRSSETLQELGMYFDTLCHDIVEAIGACTKLRRLRLILLRYRIPESDHTRDVHGIAVCARLMFIIVIADALTGVSQ